jgi:hypothetical protein
MDMILACEEMPSLLFRIVIAQVSSYFISSNKASFFFILPFELQETVYPMPKKWMHQLPEELPVYLPSPQELH